MRRTRTVSILLAFSTLLVGCHSGTPTDVSVASTTASQPPDPPAKATPAAKPAAVATNDHRPLIVCFGDSLTAGYGTDPGESYPDFLQKDLDRGGYHYRIVNEGVSGNATKDGLDRLPAVLAMKPYAVIVEFGGNDGLRGVPITESRGNLDTIVRQLKASGTRVVLAGITLPPDYGPDYIHQFTETYTILSSRYHVPLLPFLLQGVYGSAGMMQQDNTHATAKGNEVVAQNLLPVLTPILKK